MGIKGGQENDDEWGLRKTQTQRQIMIIPGAILRGQADIFFDIELIHKVRRTRFRLGIKGGQENDDEWGLRKTQTQSQIMIIPGALF